MKGLVIKSPWIEHILSGKRTWEIRGSHTSTRERIALIKSRSGRVWGTCTLADCVGPLTLDDLRANADKHQIPLENLNELPYARTYAWVLKDVQALAEPIPYKHPTGAVVWVKLTADNMHGRYAEIDPAAAEPQVEPQVQDQPQVEEQPKIEVTVYTQPAAAPVAAAETEEVKV